MRLIDADALDDALPFIVADVPDTNVGKKEET